MFALIEDATGKVLNWGTAPFTPVVGQTNRFAPDNLNMVASDEWRWGTSIAIVSAAEGNPSVITTQVAHNLVTGDQPLVNLLAGADPDLNPAISITLPVTVLSPTTFSIPMNVVGARTGGALGVSGFRESYASERAADLVLSKDRLADGLFGSSDDTPITAETFKKALTSILKVTHDHLQALESAAALPANTVPGFAAFVGLVKTDYRNRL